MKAAIYKKYGPPEVLEIAELPKPEPKDSQILIRNMSTAVNSADWRLRKPEPAAVRIAFGLTAPRKNRQILGAVFSGIVEKTGAKVSGFKSGDSVFGMTGMAMGAYANYLCVSDKVPIGLIPDNISFEEAASVPFGATSSLHFLNKVNLQKDQSILIYGASGALGTAAIQLAKMKGTHVTAVCSAENRDLVLGLGADVHIDYKTKDFTEDSTSYDVIFETVDKISFDKCIARLKSDGTLLLGSAGISKTLRGIWKHHTGKQKVISGLAMEKPEEIQYLHKVLADGTYKPVIDRVYPLEEIVEAHRYVEAGHKKGNVVIRF